MNRGAMSTSVTRLSALKLQSSAYGVTIPVVYGRTRVAPNLIFYGNFQSSQQGGGKGGGGGKAGGSYTYSAALIMALCEGPIAGVSDIWASNYHYTGGFSAGSIATATETYTVPGGGGSYTCAHAATFASTISVTLPTGAGLDGTLTRFLSQGNEYVQAAGIFTFPAGSPAVGGTATITYRYVVSAPVNPPTTQVGLSVARGELGQAVPSWLPAVAPPAQSLGYSGIAYAHASNYALGPDAALQFHNFEIEGFMAYSISATTPDIDPSAAAWDLLSNARYGANFPTQWLGDRSAWSTYCLANELLLSVGLTEQKSAAAVLASLADLTNTAPVWSEGVLKMIPYGDTSATANGVTFTPNVTPVYDLTYDTLLADPGATPITCTRKGQADIYNQVRVEFWNRANQYNVEIAEAKEFGSIQQFLLRPASVLTAHEVCDVQVARTVAQLKLQRSVYIRGTYQFRLPLNFSLLEPMDIVTLTDSAMGYTRLPVRITQIDEGDNDELSITAEDFPIGVAHAAKYAPQAGLGFSHNYNATPGSVSAVQFFEPPTELSTSGLEVWCAVRGPAASWGGCHVWVSLDGTNYKQVATINGASRFGTLTGPIAAGALAVAIPQGQLNSGTAADAAALSTLIWIGGASQEYLAYQTATLVTAGNYSLTGLIQGAYGTTAAAHANADPWVRVDGQVGKSGPLTLDWIGKTIQFKFTSFNLYGAGEESLQSVAVYSYAITGVMAKLPPAPPTSVVAVFETSGIRIVWVPSLSGDVVTYEVRQGASWSAGTLVGRANADHYYWQVQPASIYQLWVAALDPFGNYSSPVAASANVVGPGAVTGLSTQVVDNNVLFFWQAPTAGSLAIKGYQFRKGATWGASVLIGDNGSSTFFTYFEQAGGTFTYWVAPIDLAGTVGTPTSITATVQNPPDYILRSDLFSNFTVGGDYISVTPINALLQSTNLWAPVDPQTTWEAHFSGTSITSTLAAAGWESARGTTAASGKVYFEVKASSAGTGIIVGLATAAAGIGDLAFPGIDLLGYGYNSADGKLYHNSIGAALGATFATGDVIGVAVDTGALTVQFYKNNVAQGSAASIAAGTYLPMVGIYGPNGCAIVNTAGSFVYTPPTGFSALGGALSLTDKAPHASVITRAWASPQAQVSAGYTLFLEPSPATASYEEVIDYYGGLAGAQPNLPATTIVVTPTYQTIAGSVTITPTISYAPDNGAGAPGAYVSFAAGQWGGLSAGFRFVKVHLDFAGTGGTSLIEMTDLETKLSIKQRRDGGAGSATSTGTHTAVNSTTGHGDLVTFNYAFVSANAPVVQALPPLAAANLPWVAVVDFVSVPNPVGFGVLIYDRTGARVSSAFSWSDTGY